MRFPKQAALYALLQTNAHLKRSLLFFYNAEGKIAYQEVLGDACLGIAAVPEEAGDRLLIGCSGRILEYSAAGSSTIAQGTIEGESH
jgi:hypothetical protein